MTTAIQIDRVEKSYKGFKALKGVSLNIEQGEFFGLLGPNGAGKTTLISTIAGLIRPDVGSVRIHGHDVVTDQRRARMNLGVVPQELVFDPFFTVRETLRLQSGYFGLKNNDKWIDEVMENLDLTAKADVNMRALSGGMKRRVLVAQALVHKPPVIVLDEPTAGVVVLTTHYLEEAQAMCQRVAMLKTGNVVALDTMSQLLRRVSGSSLVVHLKNGALPEGLRHLVAHGEHEDATPAHPAGNKYTLRVNDYNEVEGILARLREGGATIEEMQLQQADLEDIFLQIMDGQGLDGVLTQ
jgi:ABC-2 type transport system ATP-binding protein